MVRAIIIDDEPPARLLLRKYLEGLEDVQIVDECENGFEGVKAINELKPELVFLDIEMPRLNGFEMLELLDELPMVIFITAYDQYAVKAFERHAVDYLLKPFTKERLREAVDRAKTMAGKPDGARGVKKLVKEQQDKQDIIERIAIKTGTKIRIIYTEEIHYIEAQDDYVMIYTDDGKYLKQKTMKYFETHLPASSFVRIHRSYIARIDFIDQIELYEKDAYIVKLRNGQTLPVSKSGYLRLRDALRF